MRDISVFTTPNGVASLILKEIPYKAVAYVHIRDTCQPREFLQECCDFCRAAGALKVYATGHGFLDEYPVYTEIWEMQCSLSDLPNTDAMAYSVTAENLEEWRGIYNSRMFDVPGAATMTSREARKHLEQGDGYFIYRDLSLIGIGIVTAGQIDNVISVSSGEGESVLLALCRSQNEQVITLQVASANARAVALYRKLGFEIKEKITYWYQVFPTSENG